jgi:hypothetical protein
MRSAVVDIADPDLYVGRCHMSGFVGSGKSNR